MGARNYILMKENFINENAFTKFKNDLVKDKKLIPEKGFNVKNDLKYMPNILDIIKAKNRGVLTMDYNHLDLEDVLSEILVRTITTMNPLRVTNPKGLISGGCDDATSRRRH
ncbi:hypothetical protein Syun_003650 [Stephania yunnanensis]|uniref:Uncharacterized protein n=1 Tax=Stephania yunnanensis TaxID=152371 RepID=A0AAP0L1K1_9MAGN